MTKITLSDVSNILGNPTSAANTINANNDVIVAALDLLVSRDGETPNQMTADIDLNNNDIINVDNLDANVIVLNGSTLVPGGVTEIPPESITTAMLSPGAVTTAKLADTSVTSAKLNSEAFATDPEADAGIVTTKIMSPAKVVRWFENWVTKLWGTSSLARTIRARLTDTVNLRDWLVSGTGSTHEAANTTALTNLITFLNANPTVRNVIGNMGDIYRIGGGTQWIWPSSVHLDMRGAEFEVLSTLGTGASTMFQFESKCVVLGLKIHLLTGSAFRRLVDFMDQNVVKDLLIYADTQINNVGALPLLDYCVRYRGQEQYVDGAKIIKVDKAHFVYGDGGDGVPSLGFRLYNLEAEDYVNGINLRNLRDCQNLSPRCKGKSPNALEDPGHNGITHEGVADYLLADAYVADSGEHGIRFGGTRNAEQISFNILVNGAIIVRSGQSGLKFFTGVVGGTFTNVQVSNVQVIDCAYNGGAHETPGFNDEGFLLQQIRKGTFTGLSVQRQSNPTNSCMDGVYISGADNLTINGLNVQDPSRNFVRIAETDDGGGGAAVETLANNEVSVLNIIGENCGEDGVFIDHPTQSVRDLSIHARDLIGNGAVGFFAIDTTAAVARFVQPSLVEVKQRNFASGLTSLASSGNWKVRDIFSATY